MKRLLITLLTVLLLSTATYSQVSSQNARRIRSGTGAPSGSCTVGPSYTDVYINVTDHSIYECTGASTWTKVIGGGTPGDVVGPASATDNSLVRFDGITGKLIKESTGLSATELTSGVAAGARLFTDTTNAALGGLTCTARGLFYTTDTKLPYFCYDTNAVSQFRTAQTNTIVAERDAIGVDAGASDTYTFTLSPSPVAYVVGDHLRFFANTANTGAATVNANGIGALTLVKVAGGITTTLADNDIRAGQWVDCVIAASSNCQVISNLGNSASGTTINATNGVLPYRSDATTFLDSPLSVSTGRLISTASTTASGVVPYLRIITPADTAQTADAEFTGMFFGGDASGATVTRQAADGTTIATQRESRFIGPTYTAAGATTITDVFTVGMTPPVCSTNMTCTRGHTLGILDSTSAASSTTGGLVVAATFGTAATSVGIGNGNINAGGAITLGAAASLGFSGRTGFNSGSDGVITVWNTNQNGFTRFNYGGISNSAAALGFDAVNGLTLQSAAGTATWNDASTGASGTVANRYLFGIAAPTLTATNSSVTNTVASTVFIGGAPTDSTNVTSTAKYALNVDGGLVRIGGIGSDATHTDSTVCQDTTTHALYAGSGAAGICLGTSSARFKRDIKSLDLGMQEIRTLRPVSFTYLKGYGDSGAKEQVGFVAEEVFKTMPSLVGLDKDGRPQSVDYMGVMIVTTNAMKELDARITALEKENARLRHQ